MSQMDYKQKHEQALENLKKIKAANTDNSELVDFIDYEYPELKEYWYDTFKQYLLECCNDAVKQDKGLELSRNTTKRLETWLEKQGEQKFTGWSKYDEHVLNAISLCIYTLEKDYHWDSVYIESEDIPIKEIKAWLGTLYLNNTLN